MGWWKGLSPLSALAGEESENVWGDGPADILDKAIDDIATEFEEYFERRPTKDEIRSGIEFALSGYDETGEEDD